MPASGFALRVKRGLCSLLLLLTAPVSAHDLEEIKQSGVLRHIGVPYANFVSYIDQGTLQSLTGLDVEIMKGFAASLGVRYEFVPAQWSTAFAKLTGREVEYKNKQLIWGKEKVIEGDVIANGVTMLDWRTQIIDFSDSYFPSGVWLISRTDSDLKPIAPSGSVDQDIAMVKHLIKNRNVLAMEHTCLDPNLYNLYDTGANIILPDGERQLNEMVPAILKHDAENTLLDIPDTLVALEKWPGEIKVIGPVSDKQEMAVAFRKDSPQLRQAFNQYLAKIRQDGTYAALIEKYYPSIYYFYHDYFSGQGN
ncbi:transporter substrate-binding domain-containing protein [Vibrio sp. CDRSL-10 TSBA]